MRRRGLVVLIVSSWAFIAAVVAAQEVHRYSDVRYIDGADDTLGHVLELKLGSDGRVSSAELRIYEGPAEPTIRISLEALTGGRRMLLQGKDPKRGLITIAASRSEDLVRGTIQENEDPTRQIRLKREMD